MDRGTEYAINVVNGSIVAGKDQIAACKRHLSDLERQDTEKFPYHYSEKKANRIFEFAEMLQVAEGLEKKFLELMGFQCFILGSLFGWLTKTGYRRFRVSYIEMARQNGKSFLNGVEATYISGFGKYKFGQMYCCATKHAQSMIVWQEIAKFINSDDDLRELFEVKEYYSIIKNKNTNCTIEALSRDRQKLDGFRAIWASVDELHEHKDNSVYRSIANGTGSLEESLISMVTTAGFDLNSYCYEMHNYAKNVASQLITDETFFSCIFSLDKNDNYFDGKNYIKSNPRIASVPKMLAELKNDCNRAKEMGGFELRDFLTKRLNVWVQQGNNQYIGADDWKRCGSNKTIKAMTGKRCYVGLDLSSGGDLTTLTLEFPLDNGKFYIYSHSFIPSERLNEHIKTDLAPYDMWAKSGLITVTNTFGGAKNDYDFIIAHLKSLVKKYNIEILGIGYDNHNADGFLGRLEEFGVPLVAITQSARFLNDATVDFELTVKAKNIIYDKRNELLTWSMLNAKVTKNSFGEIKVDKEVNARTKRIDPVDSIIDAHVLAMKKPEGKVDLEEVAEAYLKLMK